MAQVVFEHVSKIFLFGLLRETIPLDRLATHVKQEYSSGSYVPLAQFMCVEGRGAVILYRTFVWRRRDVNELLTLQTRQWDPNAEVSRQNGRLIGIVVLAGVAAALVLGIVFWGKGNPA